MSVPETSFPDLNEEDPGFCLPKLKAQADKINFCSQQELCMNHTHPPPCVKVRAMCCNQ